MNLQVIASPGGDILWVSGPLPGSVHDKKAEWIWGVLAGLEAAGLVTLADKGYQGAAHAKIPYRGKNKPGSQKEANRAHAKLRSPGERANAQLKNWHILRELRCCPGAPASSPRPSTYCRSTKQTLDEKGSLSGSLSREGDRGFRCHRAYPPRHLQLFYGLCAYIKSGSPPEGLFPPGPAHSPPSSYTV
jgi:DDE superfamily endonuclease